MALLLHEPLLAAMAAYREREAIVGENGNTCTYGQLEHGVQVWASVLAELKPSPRRNPFVGILAPVAAESIAAVLGTLCTGCAYVPLDELSPTERLRGVVESTGLDVLVADPVYLARHPELARAPSVRRVLLTNEITDGVPPGEVAPRPVLADDLAYVLHSSGSTGVPKGIMLTHRNARTFTDWMQREFQIGSADVVMSRAPFKFDLSVFDIFNSLSAGAKLVTFDWTRARSADERHRDYVSLMAKEMATVLYTTPSTFIALMNRGGLGQAAPPLRQVMYAGEPFPTAQLRRLRDTLGEQARIANIYGPTETNIITCQRVTELPDDDSPIPLGREVDDTEIIVVADEDPPRICGPGELGELWCRGGTVTRGYLGMPDKTAEHLVRSPFHRAPAYFWRTGDFGFRDNTGVLHYRGRRDHMVKVRGYRVELGEIESALARHTDIDDSVIVAVPDTRNGTGCILACYFTPLGGRQVTSDDVRGHLTRTVPAYMVPRLIERRVALPATSSGKVDRVRLGEQAAAALAREITAPPGSRSVRASGRNGLMSRAFDNIVACAQAESRRSLISGMFTDIQQYDVAAREIDGRRIRVRDDHWVIDFASCNYLGLDLDPQMTSTVAENIERWGVHPSWCRLVASPQIYVDLEEQLAELVGTEASLIIPTVTLISIGVIPALVGRTGVLLLDKSGHETMYEGAKIARDSGATLASYPQGDLAALRELLQTHRDNPRKVILVDGVYSMTGDHADIEGLTRLAAEYDAIVYVDDAHGFGVVGEHPTVARPFGERGNGIVKHLAGSYDNVLYVGGCSKAYSSLAAFVACSRQMQHFIKTFATPYDLSGPCPTASLATLAQGLAINDVRGEEIRDRLWALTQRVIHGLRGLGFEVDNRSGFPIISARIGDSALLLESANLLFERGILVTVCPFPMVKRGEEVHRITVTAANTDDEVDELLAAFAEVRDLMKARTGTQPIGSPAP